MKEFLFQIAEEEEGERIDKQLSLLIDPLSRSYLQKLLKEGRVFLEKGAGNRQPVKANYRVKCDDRIFLTIPEAVVPDILPENLPLSVLFEDDHLLVVNKSQGMVVHPAPGHYTGTLVNALIYYCQGRLSGINGILRPGIVHRIDRDTSGALLVCKSDVAHRGISSQLKDHNLERRYEAIVFGDVKSDVGTIVAPIGRHLKERKRMAVIADGKEAITHYRVLRRFGNYTYVECQLETGRTHQIRVHMTHIGHPLLGDNVYGNRKCPFNLNGQVLHAKTLGFVHPVTDELIHTEAPLPAYFEELLNSLSEKR